MYGMCMDIKKALKQDLPKIQYLVQLCIEENIKNGITQWNDQYPPMEIFSSDIEKGTLFTMMDNEQIIGIIVLDSEQEKQYEQIEWSDSSGKFLVVHRLAVHPDQQRTGLAGELLDFAEEYAKENGHTSIRIDTFSRNPRTLKLFQKRKYERKPGEIFFPENEEPYYCYEIIF
jgi:GNAT superfamily N-acetyltransferase